MVKIRTEITRIGIAHCCKQEARKWALKRVSDKMLSAGLHVRFFRPEYSIFSKIFLKFCSSEIDLRI